MAFQPPSTKQELQNRKILEDLQLQKKQLMLKQQAQQPALGVSANATTVGTPATLQTIAATDSHALSSSQRAALQHAHANSVGYFITQDSSFGNLILPVLPRFDK